MKVTVIGISWLLTLVCSCAVHGFYQFPNGELPPEVSQTEQRRIDVIRKAMAASICVFGPNGSGGGSGVLISPAGFCINQFPRRPRQRAIYEV